MGCFCGIYDHVPGYSICDLTKILKKGGFKIDILEDASGLNKEVHYRLKWNSAVVFKILILFFLVVIFITTI